MDDIQDYNNNAEMRAVFQAFRDLNTSLSIGIVGNKIGTDNDIIDLVRNMYATQTPCAKFELSNHGWNHESFVLFNLSSQVQLLQGTQNNINQLFGVTPKVFYPPYNNVNGDTYTACRTVGLKVLSVEVD